MSPLISVVMPVYDGERYLREAVESVLTQTLSDIELIAIDDGSTDSSQDILSEYERADDRLVTLQSERVGQSEARNRAVSAARSDLIAFLDHDDIAHPTRLERQRAFLAEHEATAIVGGAITFIDKTGRAFAEHRYPVTDAEIRAALPHTTPILPSTALVRRAAFEELGGFRRLFAPSEDLDLLLRLAERHELASLPDSVVSYRVHSAASSVQSLEQQTLASHAARMSARARAEGRPDPFDGIERLDGDTLLRMGATAEDITTNHVHMSMWLGRTLYRAGETDVARVLFDDALSRAEACGMPELAASVVEQRSSLAGRRRRWWLGR